MLRRDLVDSFEEVQLILEAKTGSFERLDEAFNGSVLEFRTETIRELIGKNVNGPDKNCTVGRADKFLDFE